MIRTIFIYGISFAALVFLLKTFEYQYVMRNLGVEVYIILTAVMFSVVGVWVGYKLTRRKVFVLPPDFVADNAVAEKLGISKRELEVFELMARGLTNQQIADELSVSINTVKSHISNLLLKLEVTRRAQVMQRAKLIGLIR